MRCLRDHIYDTTKNHDTSIARHFNDHHIGNTMAIRIQALKKVVISRIGGDRFRSLCKREVYWIFYLRTSCRRVTF